MSAYIPPEEVYSPRRSWSLIKVLDHGEGEESMAVALGNWDNRPVLALRWNGSEDNPIGNPQSRGLPTWFIVDEGNYTEALIEAVVKGKPEAEKEQILAFVRNLIPARKP